jgi:hypothetical protein
MSETPAQKSQRMSATAHHSWAQTSDRYARTRPGYDGLLARFAREIDPDGSMDATELAKRVESRKKAHFREIQRKASMARSANAQPPASKTP